MALVRAEPITICFPFVGNTIGGSHLSALTLIQNLDRALWRPVVVVHEDGPLAALLRSQGIDYQLMPLPGYVGAGGGKLRHLVTLAGTLIPLVRFLRSQSVHLVHTQDGQMHLTWTLPAKLAGARIVWHQRTKLAQSRLLRLFIRLADAVICLSRFTLHSLPPTVASRARIVANPAAPAACSAAVARCRAEVLAAAGDSSPDSLIVGTFGNLRAVKEPLVFVEAGLRLAEIQTRPVVLAVFGEDYEGYVPRMRERADLAGLGRRFVHMGFKFPVEPWIGACDLLFATSGGDAFGRTVVEAMMQGVPVVAADAGGHAEIIRHGENGLLVSPGNADAFAAAAAQLLASPDSAQRLTETARAESHTKYSVAAHVESVTAIYASVAERPRNAECEIACVIADLGSGGAQRVLTNLCGLWADAGRKVTVITLSSGSGDFFHLPRGVRRIALNSISESSSPPVALASNLRRIWMLRRALRHTGAPVVFSFVGSINILTILAATGLGKRVIVCERNDPSQQSLGRSWDWLRRRLYGRAAIVTANSVGVVAYLKRWVPAERLALVPNPVALPDPVRRAPRTAGTVLAVGQLHRQKAYDVLLNAFARSRALELGWRLRIVGAGPLRSWLETRAATLGIVECVRWDGQVRDVAAAYAESDVFVLPSRYEGMPNALLEAMGSGLPCIVSDASPGPLEVVHDGETGLVVPVENAVALAAALNRLMQSPKERDRLGAAAHAQVRAMFEPAAVLAAWDEIVGRAFCLNASQA